MHLQRSELAGWGDTTSLIKEQSRGVTPLITHYLWGSVVNGQVEAAASQAKEMRLWLKAIN